MTASWTDNLRSWWRGWQQFDLPGFFKPEWHNGPVWWLVYTFNHGTRALFGGPVVTWSRWFYDTRDTYRASYLASRVLNFIFRGKHGKESGPPLFGTTDTSWAARGAVVFWSLVGLLIVGGIIFWRTRNV